MKFLVLVAMLLASPRAPACDLSLVAPAKSILKNPVQVRASRYPDRQLFGVGAVTERQKGSRPSKTSLRFRRRGIVCDVFGYRISILRIRSLAVQPNLSGQDRQSCPASRGRRSGPALFSENSAGRLGRGIEDSPKASRVGRRPEENSREFLFDSGRRSKTQLLEFISAEGQDGELSSTSVFSAIASM